ncbi:MAG TPA: 50S ribosomal protein L25 [Anaerolineae bacterium]|nr:50S ribosomal protein L25 [Anaerolineae bacterium]HID83523.1 50S ribosomal protein L25 [Anaerolineales bacterium]HIQ08804.1 50S ribosomal protein L25 [Anaerolineaceae bacterium]
MSERPLLKAERRTVTGKKVKQLRRQGKLPGVVYGKVLEEPIPVMLDYKEAAKVLRGATGSEILDLELEGQTLPVLVREKQKDFIKGTLLHVDFQAVSMTETIWAEVPIELEGEAPAVKNYGAVLVQSLDVLEVEALPGDLPERIVIDLGRLEEIGDMITVADLVLPPSVKVMADPDEAIVVATAPRTEEEVEGAETVEEIGAEPEVIEKGKKEEEEEE